MNPLKKPQQPERPRTEDIAMSPSTAARSRTLLQGDERFRILVDSARDYAIFFMDVDGFIIDWNIGAERILGYSEHEIIGQPGAIVYTPEDQAQGVPASELEIARMEGRAANERWHVRKDNSRFWGSGIVISLRDESGNLIGFAKVMRDVTEHKCAEEERAELMQRQLEARQEAEAANRAKDEFIALVAHELRTPISVAMGWVHLLLSESSDEATKERAIATIKRSLNAQNQVINDLLDVSRITTGKIALQHSSVDLAALVLSVVESVQPIADIKSVQLETKIQSDVMPVAGDADRLQQVLLNLLSNAVKFTPREGHIEVRLGHEGEYYLLEVADNGIGIEPSLLPHIFERYQQSKEPGAEKHDGLGLGLWLVRHIVELHAGSVHAYSEGKGKGSTFTVKLPIRPAAEITDAD